MPYGERIIPVVTSIGVREGRCRHCRARILWATIASRPGRPARTLPFDPPQPWPLSSLRNDETGLVIETWPAASLHFTTCTMERPKRKSTTRRLHA